MNVLALDLGNHTGVCEGNTDALPQAQTLTWATTAEVARYGKTRANRTGDPRMRRLFDWLSENLKRFRPDWIVFEDVEFSSYTAQTQLWSSYRTVIWLFASLNSIKTECVPVTTLKKFATGAGNADKPAMERALRRKYPEIKVVGDDAIDACWLWIWAKQNLIRAPR